MSDPERFTAASGLSPTALLKGGLAAGVGGGAMGLLGGTAGAATPAATPRYVADGLGPFRVRVGRDELDDLLRRLIATRFAPTR